MSIDRSAVNRALAKALAYKQCGKDAQAAGWAAALVDLLECADILNDEVREAIRDERSKAAQARKDGAS